MKYLMVLNDGETYTNVEGCKIIGVPDDFNMPDSPWAFEDSKDMMVECVVFDTIEDDLAVMLETDLRYIDLLIFKTRTRHLEGMKDA